MANNHRIDDDDQLVYRSFHGDKQAFGELYEKYLDDIYRYIYYRIANEYESEDITEACFLQAWEALPLVNLKGFRFKPWIYRIAHNKVIDRYRTDHPTVSLDDKDIFSEETNNPESVYQINEATRTLAWAISKLDSTLQDVLIYRFVLELSHEETAELMNRSVIHIRVLQHRALIKLREWYQGEEQHYG
jgi:RNA polymerase sigma-70 factor (ECF subfamily)